MSKHSPGPWKWGDDMKSPDQSYRLLDADDNPVFWCLDKGNGPGGTRSIGATRFADLDLIAEAPAMLELLKEASRWLEDPSASSDDYQDRIAALVARIEGEP